VFDLEKAKLLIAITVFSLILVGLVLALVRLYMEREYYVNYTRRLESELSTLMIDYESKSRELELVKAELSDLKTNYTRLMEKYSILEKNLSATLRELDRERNIAISLNNSINNITLTMLSYVSIPQALPRVLNIDEVLATEWYVRAAAVVATDPWVSYWHLYAWVSSSIRYARDPLIPLPYCEYVNESCVLKYLFIENYVQSPSQTLEYWQGDCEDTAILLYAMIKYYQLFINGTEYLTWLALIEFNDNESHVAVFIPAKGGLVAILDPTGHYMTTDEMGRLVPQPARVELEKYASKWSIHGGVKNIELIRADVIREEYYLSAEGSIEKIAEYIESF
jgi:hypothetical protein